MQMKAVACEVLCVSVCTVEIFVESDDQQQYIEEVDVKQQATAGKSGIAGDSSMWHHLNCFCHPT